MKHLWHLNRFFVRYKWLFLLGVLMVTVSNIFGVLPPIVIRHAFDLVKENIAWYHMFEGMALQGGFYQVFTYGLLLFGITVLLLAILKGLFMFFMRQTMIVMSRHIEYDMRNEIYSHYQQLDQAFYKRNKTGDMMSRVAEDVSRVRMYIGPAIMYALNTIVLFVMVIAVMLSVNPELTLYVLLPLPVLSLSIYYVNNLIQKRSERIQQQLSHLTTIAQEVYSGIRVIKSYVQENTYLRFFNRENETYKDRYMELARVEALFFPLMLLLIGLSTIITIYVGGIYVVQGRITPGNIAEFVIYVNMLTWPVTAIGWVASIIQRAAASQKRINEFMHTRPSISSPPGAKQLEIQGGIEFRGVDFTYPDTGVHALKSVDFKIEPGQKVAIVGRTGTGKSTLVDLMMRLYDVDKGDVRVDGHDIRTLDLGHFRSQVGYVPQDVFLFSDTIRDNITFGSKGPVAQEDVEAAAKAAGIHKEIEELPDGYDTLVGERGVTLSGGQKQRISLARAFVQQPRLLLLDDCLSAVDANTEQAILRHLNIILKDRTAIIITHRIFSLLTFHNILVLDDGRIAEAGSHKELIAKKGLYFQLFEQQKREGRYTES
jgi:ATP-binding cassette, subfamily B, multidrug efflux pump